MVPGNLSIVGGETDGCYQPVAAENKAWCYQEDEWLATDDGGSDDGDTGGPGEAAPGQGISRNEWPTHTASLSYINAKCTAQCKDGHANGSGKDYVCDNPWTIYGKRTSNYTNQLATELDEPRTLTCNPWYSKNKAGLSPSTTTVIPAGASPQWVDGAYVSLSCSDFLTCSDLFDEPVLIHLTHSIASLPGADESEADYLATSSGTSSSSLTLKVNNPAGPSQKSNWVGGRVEYTAAACGESTCPFYLGNLTLGNDTDTWDMYSDELLDDVDVSNIDVQLRRPVLGVWRPGTGEIYLGDEMLDLRIEFDIAIGSGAPTTVTKYVTNSGSVFGEVGSGNTIEFSGISMVEGDLEATATLDYDSLDGSPPIASFSLSRKYVLSPAEDGLLVSSITDNSSDPDSDLDYELWLVDGVQVAPGYEIPTGPHTVRLEVRDSRFGFDYDEQSVIISY